MELIIEPGDITQLKVDAIVNAANSGLMGGGGVDGAIHSAGGPSILRECKEIRRTRYPEGLPAGTAVSTTAGELPATWVIHTVGPVFAVSEDRSATLASAYRESLIEAKRIGASSVAFPAISAGVYGWPMDDAARIAVVAVKQTAADVEDTVRRVVFVPFGEDAEKAFRAQLG